jgi:hypothetical protein
MIDPLEAKPTSCVASTGDGTPVPVPISFAKDTPIGCDKLANQGRFG